MEKVKLADSVYWSMKERIRNHDFGADECIVENDLCQWYDVSKATAGEVLGRLSKEGCLTSYPRKGYMLSVYNYPDFMRIQRLRYAVESMVVTQVIGRVSPRLVRAAFSRLTVMSNYDFHLNLAWLIGDRFVSETLDNLLTKSINTYADCIGKPREMLEPVDYHAEIIAAILAGDEQQALQFLMEDLRFDPNEPCLNPDVK